MADVTLTYNAVPAPDFESKVQKRFADLEKRLQFKGPFGNMAREVRDFQSELDRANQRVITLGSSFAVLSTSIRTLKEVVRATIEVEKSLTEINSVFNLSAKNLDTFSKDLFNVARNTSQSFEKAAEAAKEFSRQGLSAEQTLRRTNDALILTRLANLDVTKSVEVLTASINGFQKSALSSTEIVNKLATVDAKFAVSSKDLAEALARSGAAASDAGVSFDQLLGIVTAAQQTTARGGAVIGNSLKTIFTRVERRDTIEAFRSLGVAVEDANGQVLSAIPLLTNFAKIYDTLGGSVRKQAAELVGGVYQINILKAVLGDLAKQYGIVTDATATSKEATDEAIIRNEKLNQTLESTIARLAVTGKQIGANIGSQSFTNPFKTIAGFLQDNPITKALEDATGKADTAGGKAAEMFLSGFGNAVVFGLGPLIAKGIGTVTKSVYANVIKDFSAAAGLNAKSEKQAQIQNEIVALYKAGGDQLQRQLATISTIAEKAAYIQKILVAGANNPNDVRAMTSALYKSGYRGAPKAAEGYIPIAEEMSAISRGIGGAPASAKPVYLPSFNRGGGARGIVANTSEFIVPGAAGGAIFNREMIKKYGLPPGSVPVAAGGYIPNMAKGGNPYGLPDEYSDPNYYKYTSSEAAAAKIAQEKAEAEKRANEKARKIRERDFLLAKKENEEMLLEEEKLEEKRQKAQEKALRQKEKDYEKLAKLGERVSSKKVSLTRQELRDAKETFDALDEIKEQWRQEAEAKGQVIRIGVREREAKQRAAAAVQKFEAERNASAGSGASYNKYLKRAGASGSIAAFSKDLDPVYPETYFKKNLSDLRLLDIIAASKSPGLTRSTADRSFGVQTGRQAFSRDIVGKSGVNSYQLSDALQSTRAIAGGKTLLDQFNTRVQGLVSSGTDMESAYKTAIAELRKETANRKQINDVIRKSLPVNVAFQNEQKEAAKALAESQKAYATEVKLSNKMSQAAIERQAILNEANRRVSSGEKFNALPVGLQRELVKEFKQSAIEKLGFGGQDVSQVLRNKSARYQINTMVSEQIAALNNYSKTDVSGNGSKASVFQRLRDRLSSPGAGLALSIAPAFLGGAIGEGAGGTREGMVKGALGSGLTGVSFGASVGSAIGPIGAGYGALIGGTIGSIIGFLGKTKESFEELSARLDESMAETREEFNAAISANRLRREANIAESEGRAGEAQRLREEALEMTSRINNQRYLDYANKTGMTQKEEEMFAKEGASNISAQNTRNNLLKMGKMGRPEGFAGFLQWMEGLAPTEARKFNFSSDFDPKDVMLMATGVGGTLKGKDDKFLTDLLLKSATGGQSSLDAMKSVYKMGGMTDQETQEALSGMNPNAARASIMMAVTRAMNRKAQNKDDVGSVENLTMLRSLTSQYGFQGQALEAGFNQKASIFRNSSEIMLRNPMLSERDMIAARGALDVTSMGMDFETNQALAINRAKQRIAEIQSTRGATTDAVKAISEIKDFDSVTELLSKINTPESRLKGTTGGAEIEKELRDLMLSLNGLKLSTDANVEASKTNTEALLKEYERKGTVEGAREEYAGAAGKARKDLERAVSRNDPIDIIRPLRIQNEIATLREKAQAGMSRSKYLGGMMNIGLINDRDTRDEEYEAVRELVLSGQDYALSGSAIGSAMMGKAKNRGLAGDAQGSFLGGFRSVIEQGKRDLMDFSEIGAQVANSLQSNLTSFWTDFVTGATKGKDAFRGFVVSVLTDASRMLASKAFTAALSAIPGFSGFGLSTGGRVGFASGGMVPAMLTGGEYVFGPEAVRRIGPDTLRRINGYAAGGMVSGGSGVKDDVPANLPAGSFVIKKSATQRLGPGYLNALAEGKVQNRFFGGILSGALTGAAIGGGLGYLTGGKKGAIGGALIGAIGGGMYGYQNSQMSPAMQAYGLQGEAATLSVGAKAALGLGASAGLGMLAAGITSKGQKAESSYISNDQVPALRARLEANQLAGRKEGQFPFLQINPQGGYSLAGFDMAPATRRWAEGGGVDVPMSIGPSNSAGSTGGGSPQVYVKIDINNEGGVSSSAKSSGGGNNDAFGGDFAGRLEKAVRPIVQDELVRQSKSDGFLTQRSRYVS